jgi:hypothetical protein
MVEQAVLVVAVAVVIITMVAVLVVATQAVVEVAAVVGQAMTSIGRQVMAGLALLLFVMLIHFLPLPVPRVLQQLPYLVATAFTDGRAVARLRFNYA